MGSDLLTTIQRFELLAFFAGYPLLYTLANVLAPQKLSALLSSAYALVGTFFLLFLLWPLLLGQPVRAGSTSIVLLRTWGVLAMLFWTPRLRTRSFLSFLHSLVFFGLIVVDTIGGAWSVSGRDQIHNDMLLFTGSFLLNAASLAILFAFNR